MKPFNNFTIVVQGPLHKNSILAIRNVYKNYTDHIIVSYWDTDDKSKLVNLSGLSVELVENKFEEPSLNWFNGQNIYFQLFNTLEGLRRVSTPFVIKVRSDQYFGNLEPMFKCVMDNPDKYSCANLHFRPSGLIKYHASDKMIGGDTKMIRDTFEIAMHRVQNNVQALLAGAYMYHDGLVGVEPRLQRDMKRYSYANQNRVLATQYPQTPEIGTIQILPGGYIGTVSEIVIATSFLFSKGIYPDPQDNGQIVRDNFRIVRVEDMYPYVNKDGNSVVEHNSHEIDSIEQY